MLACSERVIDAANSRAHLLSTLVEVLRDLFRPRRPQVEPAEVVPFSAERAAHADKEVDGDRSKAA
jgi:hypothetical protein